jgi:hypothetical protein
LVIGKDKVDPETDKFDSISLVVGNPLNLFRWTKSFGYINSLDEHLVEALNAQEDLLLLILMVILLFLSKKQI